MLAVATVEEVRRTGTIINSVHLEVELTLTVQPENAPPYQATTRTLVQVWEMNQLQPGQQLAVRFDPARPNRVQVDPNPPAEWLEHVGRPTPSPVTADEILATGMPATAQIVDIQLTGKTAGDFGGNPQHPERSHYPTAVLDLMVQPPTGPGFTTKALYAVPPDRLAGLARGAMLPVRYVDHGTPLVAVAWDAARWPALDGVTRGAS